MFSNTFFVNMIRSIKENLYSIRNFESNLLKIINSN